MSATDITPRLLPMRDAARFLGVSKNTLLAMTEQGEIKAYWLRSRRVFRREDLLKVIEGLPEYKPPNGGKR